MDCENQSSYRQRLDSNASTESTRGNNYRRTYHRVRLQTEALHASCAQTGHLEAFQENVRIKNRTTNLEEEKLRNIDYDESILGMVRIYVFKDNNQHTLWYLINRITQASTSLILLNFFSIIGPF